LTVIGELVDKGNTVITSSITSTSSSAADHIIDLGPEGGDKGGRIVAVERRSNRADPKSVTGEYLRPYLKQ